jgi:hypothetical protein
MHIGIRALVAAGAVSLLAMGPAAVASATSPSHPAAAPSTAKAVAPPAEVKGFIQLRGFPRGALIKGGMGTFYELCSRGNNGRPFEFRDEALLDVTVTHQDWFWEPRCLDTGPRSEWELVIVSPDGVKGRVTFSQGWDDRGKYLYCRDSSGDIRCLNDRTSGPDLRMIVEPTR